MSKSSAKAFKWPVIGHSNIVSYLQHGLANDSVSHAYLFVGPSHVGKQTVARQLVHSLMCDNLNKAGKEVPCNECQGCKQALNGLHPDIYYLDRELNEKTEKLKKNISIEQVRKLQDRLSHHSFLNSYKVAVISQAEALSSEAANALLKTLEEPSPKTVLILMASSQSLLPETIVSRCQVMRFLPVGSREIIDRLVSLKVDLKKAKALAAVCFGRPGIALNYAEEKEHYASFQQEVKSFVSLLNADDYQRLNRLAEVVDLKNVDSALESLNIWRKVFRDVILVKYSAENLISNLRISEDLAKLAKSYNKAELVRIISEIDLSKRYLKANVNPKLTLENLVLNF